MARLIVDVDKYHPCCIVFGDKFNWEVYSTVVLSSDALSTDTLSPRNLGTYGP